jgi:hypothetical protein
MYGLESGLLQQLTSSKASKATDRSIPMVAVYLCFCIRLKLDILAGLIESHVLRAKYFYRKCLFHRGMSTGMHALKTTKSIRRTLSFVCEPAETKFKLLIFLAEFYSSDFKQKRTSRHLYLK